MYSPSYVAIGSVTNLGPERRKQLEPQNGIFQRRPTVQKRAGREEQPEGVQSCILSLLVTTTMKSHYTPATSQRKGQPREPPHSRRKDGLNPRANVADCPLAKERHSHWDRRSQTECREQPVRRLLFQPKS